MTRVAVDPSCDGIFDVIRKTFAEEGVLGFYRGFFVSLLGIILYRAAYLGLYNRLRVIMF